MPPEIEEPNTPPDEAPAHAVKFSGKDTIEGPVFLFGYRDFQGELFTPDTDLCLDWFGKSGRPLLYEHGFDEAQGATKIGRQIDFETREEGIWAQSQLDAHVKYRRVVDKMIEAGQMGYSAGAMPHLARKSATGAITRFPWVETSLTPTPSAAGNLGVYYVKSAADAVSHLENADIPDPLKAALAALDEWAGSRDSDSLPDGLKVADLIDRLSVDGPAWVKARRDWYAKSGRVLSAATRERLAAHPQALRQLADDLDELLTSADAPKDAKSWLELEWLRAQSLGVEVPPMA